MADKDTPFILYDGTILIHLKDRKKNPHFRPHGGGMQAFEGLQHPQLVRAFLDKKYITADSLLRKLTAPLPPADAMAACLCALGGSEARMHALLDHCPPLPEFQFLGVGKTASLLSVAAQLKKHNMLDLLLKRGADPNGGPTPQTAAPPLEAAFCANAYLCLNALLKAPNLRLELTEKMLYHWASLQPDLFANYSDDLMCCQLLLEALTGKPADPDDPLPFPPQMTLNLVLNHLNLPLASHICRKRPLEEQEKTAAVEFLSADHRIILLDERALDLHREHHRQKAEFLLSFLDRHPELIHLPELRFPILSMVLVPNKPDPNLQSLVAQMADGPVFLKELSAPGGVYSGGFPAPKLKSLFTLSQYLFPRWDERLGSRFLPAMDLSADLYLPFMSDEEVQLVLDRIVFTGQRPKNALSRVGEQFLRYAPEAMLPTLLQPGGLLTLESPHALLDTYHELSPARCNQILPYLHKSVDYEL